MEHTKHIKHFLLNFFFITFTGIFLLHYTGGALPYDPHFHGITSTYIEVVIPLPNLESIQSSQKNLPQQQDNQASIRLKPISEKGCNPLGLSPFSIKPLHEGRMTDPILHPVIIILHKKHRWHQSFDATSEDAASEDAASDDVVPPHHAFLI